MDKKEIIAALSKTDFTRTVVAVALSTDEIIFVTKNELPEDSPYRNIVGLKSEEFREIWGHSAKLTPLNAFALRYNISAKYTKISSGAARTLSELANKIPMPTGVLSDDGKYIELAVPALKVYGEAVTRFGAYPIKHGYRIRIDKLAEFELANANWKSKYPKIQLNREALAINSSPIIGFDGSIDSLREIPIDSLNVVKANIQNYKALKASKETLDKKLAKLGIGDLHSLLFRLPRRYIDKSNPQLISELIVGEEATVIGVIISLNELNSLTPGLRVTIKDTVGTQIPVTFWRQNWLKAKYKVGDEVIINGAVGEWKGNLQLGGKSIEHFDEGVNMPVVPIYRQSESAGVTSGFLISAMRELLQRLGPLSLPVYFKNKERSDMKHILSQLHFPSDLDSHGEAVLAMAYYELVYMQLIIQHERDSLTGKPGLAISKGERDLQSKAVESLPYSLTGSQVKAVRSLNKKLSTPQPASTLLLADVGAGKTLTAQLACLRAVDAGYQTVIVGPTEVLARQLYSNTLKLTAMLEEATGEKVRVGLLAGSMKAAEKKEILKAVEAHELDILIGTHSVLNAKVNYSNLGFIVIDEQQKFGAEQRSALLESRPDGRVPDLLMQTATPIPRTTAQAYYGDIDIITMDEKPPGRTPINTQWIQEDPQTMLTEKLHPVWLDVASEAEKGNQTFVIAPMVIDSAKVDSASVERAFKELSNSTLSHLKIGFVHGSMKAEAQRETMEKFRAGELQVLVASTVIEVGVDIPDATRVVILSADRLGASSLHQIRGRVGRSNKASKAYLVSLGKNEHSQKRLQGLVDSENGFEIAKIDLEIRGEGAMFSTDQSGRSDMIFAKLSTHKELIEQAKEEAKMILKSPFSAKALQDAHVKFVSPERLF